MQLKRCSIYSIPCKDSEHVASHPDSLKDPSRVPPPPRGGGTRDESLRESAWKANEHAYIGQTKRHFGTRLKEHQKAVFLCKKENSALLQHASQINHTIGWNNSEIITPFASH